MIDLRTATLDQVVPLFEQHHGYGSVGRVYTYCFAVFEHERPVAAFVWAPPSYGAALKVAPACPSAALALTRMVAVPRSERQLRHISKPLRQQMRRLVDRTRYPVLVTFADESMGHTGHVYKCSGWQFDGVVLRPVYVNQQGHRVSPFTNGGRPNSGAIHTGTSARLRRFVHRACPPGTEQVWLEQHGWVHKAIPGRWRSGSQKRKWVREAR